MRKASKIIPWDDFLKVEIRAGEVGKSEGLASQNKKKNRDEASLSELASSD
jgi:hypothetical protein